VQGARVVSLHAVVGGWRTARDTLWIECFRSCQSANGYSRSRSRCAGKSNGLPRTDRQAAMAYDNDLRTGLRRAASAVALAANPRRQRLPLRVVAGLPASRTVVRVRAAAVGVERLQQEAARRSLVRRTNFISVRKGIS
jgi:hypothetical protein